jgi:wyosine [tRNA(Phe)-imidazoG37] synthetase (radical SAM superfamily)
MKPAFKYIYGPVPSWRLGSSLGVDLLSQEEKICNFDCVYCQLGVTKKHTVERKIYVPVEKVIEELGSLPDIVIDYITFSGRGEPTLAENLGELIKAVKLIRKEPIAVLTNGSLMGIDELRKELVLADFIVAKLDACSPESLKEINRPAEGMEFGSILDGIKKFRKDYQGKLALQIMFIENNKLDINKYIYLANYIKPDEVQVNTPLRPCNTKPLTKEEILKIKDYFTSVCKGINVVSVYDERAFKEIASISDEDTLKRRGKVIHENVKRDSKV